jgi:GTP-binding protein
LFINRDELFSDQYKKYLGNQLRRAFGYEGCPIVLVPKSRPRTVEPIRKFTISRQRNKPGPGRKNRKEKVARKGESQQNPK